MAKRKQASVKIRDRAVQRLQEQSFAHIEYLLRMSGFNPQQIDQFKHDGSCPTAAEIKTGRFKESQRHLVAFAQEIRNRTIFCRRAWLTKRWSQFGFEALELGITRGAAFVTADLAWQRRFYGKKRFKLESDTTSTFINNARKIAAALGLTRGKLSKKELYNKTKDAHPTTAHIGYNTFTKHYRALLVEEVHFSPKTTSQLRVLL